MVYSRLRLDDRASGGAAQIAGTWSPSVQGDP
jgi:hypothetical protein